MKYIDKLKNINITANEIEIGKNVNFGNNINIKVKGKFSIGNNSRLGNDTQIFGNNVIFGEHLFNSSGLRIGGGGRQHPNANFKIGDRCTIHNNFINVCEEVNIGDDVGLSPDTSIVTHGYWMSVLEGFPASFKGVSIGNGVIVGYRSLILMGVTIAPYIVVGANSVVTRNLDVERGIYAGSPAKYIKTVAPLDQSEKEEKLKMIIEEYLKISKYHGINTSLKTKYPYITMNDFTFNVETFEYEGEEDEETDDMRDYFRKWGIRIYTERPFVSKFSFE
ncbi:MAG: acyltransferase [Bacteroidales bacterium]|nr:acyltransferase [Bacteroidales bacterium]MCF8402553.1 acyltransferase [Bacteroidales bacterium]